MERLELFEREQRGERNMTCLRNAISSLYDGVFPLYLSNNQIWKDLQGSFENPEDLTYKSWRAVLYWIKRIRDEEFLSDPFLSNKTLAIPEWFARSDAETIKGGKKELGDWFIELFTKYDNENDNEMPGHTLGGIWLEQKGDYVVFSYPRIPYADYSWITKEIFSLKSRRTDNIKIDCRRSSEICNTQGDNAPLYQFFPNGKKKYCTIQMTTDSKRNNVLRHSAYFLIDFIVGYLASFHNSTGAYSDNIRAALNKLKHNISYPINDELERILTQSNAPKNNYLPKDMQSKSKEMIDILSKLSEDCTEKILCIPEYRINTSRLFELYCYLILGNCYDRRLTYQKNIGDGYPDITVEGEKLFFDAKYKFQYDQQVYCELTDVNRMLNYIMQERDYHGYFIYPDMKLLERPKNIQQIVDDVKLRLNNETAKTEWLSKIGIPFPIRNNTSEHEKA